MVDMVSHMPPVQDNILDLNEEPSDIGRNRTVDNLSVTLPLPELFSERDHNSSTAGSTPEFGADVLVTALDSIRICEQSMQRDDEDTITPSGVKDSAISVAGSSGLRDVRGTDAIIPGDVSETITLEPFTEKDDKGNDAIRQDDASELSNAGRTVQRGHEEKHAIGVDDSSEINISGPSYQENNGRKDATRVGDVSDISMADPSELMDDEMKSAIRVDDASDACVSKPSKQRKKRGKDVIKANDALQMQCPDDTHAAPRRGTGRKSRMKQTSQITAPARSSRRAANRKALPHLSSLRSTKKGRRSVNTRPRLTVWGSLRNISQVFQPNSCPDINLTDHESRKECANQGNGRRGKSIILKVKIGNEEVRSHATGGIPATNSDGGNCFANLNKFEDQFSHNDKTFEENISRGMGLLQSCGGNLENKMKLSCTLGSDAQLVQKDNDLIIDEETLGFKDESLSQKVSRVVADNGGSDPGTSPDSEVINLTSDVQVNVRGQEDLHGVFNSCQNPVAAGGIQEKSWKEGEKEYNLSQMGDGSHAKLIRQEKMNNAPGFRWRARKGDQSYTNDDSISSAIIKASCNKSNDELVTRQSEFSETVTDSGISCTDMKTEIAGHDAAASLMSEKSLPHSKGRKLSKSSRPKGANKSKSGSIGSASKREKSKKEKGNQVKLVGHSEISEQEDGGWVACQMESSVGTGNHLLPDVGETGDEGFSRNVTNLDSLPGRNLEQSVPSRSAWVLCDDCQKWRRIPAALADKIDETNCRWTCKENTDTKFANCTIPQEKSNAEINAELELSDASGEEDACQGHLATNHSAQKLSSVAQSSWRLIRSNLFLHRNRKTQSIDEIMVCHCKSPLDGRMGCGDGCLNRMLNIECVKGTCPCGDLCSNQQFQKRKYAKLKSFRCGKKGYGLQSLEDIYEGQFLIEYVGEVLDVQAYEARQREYASKGHKHFYFMTLNGSEVIDACAKGNLGRFINHSCDPNCRTEKWMVNGEVCIGLFALRHIKKGEEVTFDYNYVRVFGAAAKKCICGSAHCRGYIGGDPSNVDVVVQGDSDEEYPEPIMVCENGEMDDNAKNKLSMSNTFDDSEDRTTKEQAENKHRKNMLGTMFGHSDTLSATKTGERFCQNNKSGNWNDSTEYMDANEEKLDLMHTSSTRLKVQTDAKEYLPSGGSMGTSFHSNNVMSDTISTFHQEIESMDGSAPLKVKTVDIDSPMDQLPSAGSIETSLDSDNIITETISGAEVECSVSDRVKNLVSGAVVNIPSTMLSNPLPDTADSKKPKPGVTEGASSKSRPLVKSSRSSSSVKKGKSKSDAVYARKAPHMERRLHVTAYKPKKIVESPSHCHFETVEDKLNELLDLDGGISKRKDASRGYLKLLLLTAASEVGGNGEAIQSNRDLSMILDAILKTKSRTVLIDVINKNGLQMLHNIMKRYRREFNKIPILRKLLKVLEYLAMREILTSEHINGGPPCPGVESLRESILALTEHVDKQVHQIARSFRDKWIPRHLRKSNCMDRNDCRLESQRILNYNKLSGTQSHWGSVGIRPSEARDCMTQSVVASTAVDASMIEGSTASPLSAYLSNGSRIRKRKSRWDNPAEGSRIDNADNGRHNNVDEDVPPGFSSPLNGLAVPSDSSSSARDLYQRSDSSSKHPFEVVIGHAQKKFISQSSVSYGIPLPVAHQFGTCEGGTFDGWAIAPGVPFHPFPPLPPQGRHKKIFTAVSEPARKAEPGNRNCDSSSPGQHHFSIPAASRPHEEISGAEHQLESQRVNGSNNLGRKYFRQQKWTNPKLVPPWIRNKNGWGLTGNPRNGTRHLG